MSLYEHVFLTRQDVSAQQVETLTETFTGVIAEGGGQVEKTEYWGLKSLTFRVKKNRKAHFTLMNIDAPHAAVAEMERQMALSEDIIRFLTLKVDEHEAGPSAMMRSRGGRDRDDRRGRRGDGRPPREEGRPPRESEEKSGDSEKPAEAPAGPPAEAAATEAPSKTPAEAAATEAPSKTPAEAAATEAPSKTPAEAAPTEAPSETPAEAAATETPSQTPAEAADAAPAAEEEAKS